MKLVVVCVACACVALSRQRGTVTGTVLDASGARDYRSPYHSHRRGAGARLSNGQQPGRSLIASTPWISACISLVLRIRIPDVSRSGIGVEANRVNHGRSTPGSGRCRNQDRSER